MRPLIAASILLLPTQGFAAPPAETTASAQPNTKICRVDPEDTGSKIRRRICKTEADWNGTREEKRQAPSEQSGTAQGAK
jgi:hypothetical protein